MDRVRQLATRTPAGRERYVDLLRAAAIIIVVYGHWTDTVIAYDRTGHVTGYSATPELRWAHPLTWLFQVIPVFFLVGGFANAASLTSTRTRGGTTTDWLLDRSARLIRPTTVLVATLLTGSLLARLLGSDPTETRTAVAFATIPLWFLCAYIAVVGLTPWAYALHRRLGLLVPLLLVVLVAAGDLGRLHGHGTLSAGNFLFGWLAIHQVGFAWYDTTATTDTQRRGLRTRRLPIGRPLAITLTAVGLGALLLLTVVGPYPVSMLTTPGERELDNSSPPSLALLALATLQLGIILLLYQPAQRWLHRRRPWRAVIAVNAVVLTIFLWHISAVLPLTAALNAAHWLPAPPVGTGTWWAWRIPWLLALTVILLGLLAIFGPIETRASSHPRTTTPDRRHGHRTGRHRTILTLAGYAGVVLGLLINSAVPMSTPEPLGLPPLALAAYLAGAGILRLLRSARWPHD